MPSYKVVCTVQKPEYLPTTHAHIVGIQTGSFDYGEVAWTLAEVLSAIDRGSVFYTVSPSTGKIALVRKAVCPHCNRYIIKSAPDAVTDNNLDNIRRCS